LRIDGASCQARAGNSRVTRGEVGAEEAKWLPDAIIQAITGPVIFVPVVIGIASIGNLAKAGGLAAKALIYFFTMTVVAIVSFFTDNVLAGSFVQPFVENETLRILLLGILTAAAISFLADAERKKASGCLGAAGASRQSVGMAIPTGYSFNLDGTCIYLTMAALFIVQATGQDMAIGQQIALAALMIITSKGAAGITGAGLVTLVASLQGFGGTFFTAESIALVVGIDRIMSEGRALTDCIGNGVATMVIARYVEDATERALRGEDVEPQRFGGRFECEKERELVVPSA
jgi:aerobic C4-dicarboxylate transport protein